MLAIACAAALGLWASLTPHHRRATRRVIEAAAVFGAIVAPCGAIGWFAWRAGLFGRDAFAPIAVGALGAVALAATAAQSLPGTRPYQVFVAQWLLWTVAIAVVGSVDDEQFLELSAVGTLYALPGTLVAWCVSHVRRARPPSPPPPLPIAHVC